MNGAAGRHAGVDLMGWEGTVNGLLRCLAALISLQSFLLFQPPTNLPSIHADAFWWLVSLKITSAEEVISQSVALISGWSASCLSGCLVRALCSHVGLLSSLFHTWWALTFEGLVVCLRQAPCSLFLLFCHSCSGFGVSKCQCCMVIRGGSTRA